MAFLNGAEIQAIISYGSFYHACVFLCQLMCFL